MKLPNKSVCTKSIEAPHSRTFRSKNLCWVAYLYTDFSIALNRTKLIFTENRAKKYKTQKQKKQQ